MTPICWTRVVYVLMGVGFSTMAHIGHKRRFGYRMHWLHLLVGVFSWPVVLFLGSKVK